MIRLIHYDRNINDFVMEDALCIYRTSFDLVAEEIELLRNLLSHYQDLFYQYGSQRNNYNTVKDSLKKVKDTCEQDWKIYMSYGLDKRYSQLNGDLIQKVEWSSRPNQLKQSIVHSILRIGEYFYITDQEMQELSEDMELFISSGDCKLFDNIGSPYGVAELENSLEEDILNKEKDIRNYLKENGLKDIPAEDILKALETVRKWMNLEIEEIPKWARDFLYVCKRIRKEIRKHEEDFARILEEGISPELIIQKRSGFCLNKEEPFRIFLEKTQMASWKNPEGSWLVGRSRYPFPKGVFRDTKYLSWWDMDNIYYSLGKGPWLKTRYVGQPCSFYQNLAELPAGIIKNTIKKIKKEWTNGGEFDPSIVNIYENYNELLDMVHKMEDSVAMDFSSYSDYLSRNVFPWIMKYLWGLPKEYRDLMSHLMSLPIRVNGKTYYHSHGSVMGIKCNFLLITFANALMWCISNILSGCDDRCKIMGDDRITTHHRKYTEEEVLIQLSVPAYFNCVTNMSKTEWLDRDGYTSFCKRTFNREGEQITGIGGEFGLKQKPFMNDVSVWLNVMNHNEIPVTKKQVIQWVEYFKDYFRVTYSKFQKTGDPELVEIMEVLFKIPYYYGGWGLEDPDEALETILLRSVMSTVDLIMAEMDGDFSDANLNKIREYIRYHGGEDNRYYLNLVNSNSYAQDFERIQQYIDDITYALNSNTVSLEDMKKARSASQRIMEIVLERDSRLANSSSTKNRIDYQFDQDRVGKIRAKYLYVALEEEQHKLNSTMIDSSVLKESLDQFGGIREYLDYMGAKTRSDGRFVSYSNAFHQVFFGVSFPRSEGNKIYRISSDDSSYEHYTSSNPSGKFLNWEDLSEDERKTVKCLSRPRTRKVVDNLGYGATMLEETCEQYLIKRLTELFEE